MSEQTTPANSTQPVWVLAGMDKYGDIAANLWIPCETHAQAVERQAELRTLLAQYGPEGCPMTDVPEWAQAANRLNGSHLVAVMDLLWSGDRSPYTDRGDMRYNPPRLNLPAKYWLFQETPPEGRWVVFVGALLDGQAIEISVACADEAEAVARDEEIYALSQTGTPQPLPDYAGWLVGRPDATLVASYGVWRVGGVQAAAPTNGQAS